MDNKYAILKDFKIHCLEAGQVLTLVDKIKTFMLMLNQDILSGPRRRVGHGSPPTIMADASGCRCPRRASRYSVVILAAIDDIPEAWGSIVLLDLRTVTMLPPIFFEFNFYLA